MRNALTIAALAFAAAPLAAQRTAATPARVLAAYDFRNAPRDTDFPRSVTVADSAGTILASAALTREGREIPMTVTIIESNLVLQGQTADGVLTLILDRQNEGGAIKLTTGTWTLGRAQGTLRGREER